MNRQIKFRAMRKDGQAWVFGSFIHNSIDCPCIIDNDAEQYEVIPETVGQFTGLKDNNGVDIYEGDKVKIVYTDWPSNNDSSISLDDYLDSISKNGFVAFEFDRWSIMLNNRYDELYSSSIDPGTHGRIKVIGNIHEKEVTNG